MRNVGCLQQSDGRLSGEGESGRRHHGHVLQFWPGFQKHDTPTEYNENQQSDGYCSGSYNTKNTLLCNSFNHDLILFWFESIPGSGGLTRVMYASKNDMIYISDDISDCLFGWSRSMWTRFSFTWPLTYCMRTLQEVDCGQVKYN